MSGIVGNLAVRVSAQIDGLKSSLDQANGYLKNFSTQVEGIGEGLSHMASLLGVGFSLHEIEAFGEELLRLGEDTERAAIKTGMTTDEVQKLQYIATQTGGSFDGMINAVAMLEQRLGKGDKGAIGALHDLGINLGDLKTDDPYQAMLQLSDALGKVESPTKVAADMAALFGKSWREQAPSILSNMAAIGEAAPMMSNETVHSLSEAEHAFEGFKLTIRVWAAESYNYARGFFDWLVQASFGVIASVYNVSASMADWAEKVPGAAKALGLVGMNAASLREKAQWATDAQKAMQLQMEHATPAAEAMGKALGNVAEKSDKAAKAAERAAKAAQQYNDHLAGRDKIEAANKMSSAIESMGIETTLSAAIQNEYNRTLTDALDVYIAIGQAMPIDQLKAWAALQLKVTDGLGQFMKNGKLGLGTEIPLDQLKTQLPIPSRNLSGMIPQLGRVATEVAYGHGNMPEMGTSWIDKLFGGSQALGSGISNVLLSAFTGGGNAGKSMGGFLGGTIFKSLGSMAGNAIGGTLGSVIGSVIPGLGTIVGGFIGSKLGSWVSGMFGSKGRDTVKQFADSMGGFDALHQKLSALGDAGEQLWTKLTQGVGKNNPEQAQEAIKNVTDALNAQKTSLQSLPDLFDAVNQRATAFGDALGTKQKPGSAANQGEFNTLGTFAVSAFGANVQENGGPLAALAALKPTLDILAQAQAQFGFQVDGTVQRLMSMNAAVQANLPAFQALQADSSILQAALKANWSDMSLFAAASTDVAAQIEKITANGVPLSQALALNQPVLQSLWEAQQKFKFTTDDATQALINQAVEQGIVGPQMRDVNHQILDVLMAIGKVLGADIPNALAALPGAAQNAANGMNNAFGGVRAPDIPSERGGGSGDTGPPPDVPQLAAGGIVRKPTLALIGEAGPEAVVPLSGRGGHGGTSTIILEVEGQQWAEIIVPHIPGVVRRYGLA